MSGMRLGLGLIALLVGGAPGLADRVVPSDRVTGRVQVRGEASTDSDVVGALRPRESAEFLGSEPRWFKVRLDGGTEGFVSKSWTKVVPDGGPTTLAPAPTTPTAHVPFEVHFLDVGTGDSAIIDMGDREVVIDGGEAVGILHDYAARTNIIDGDIELVVVTHGDMDHWKGLTRLLAFSGATDGRHRPREFWEPGYNRGCRPLQSYTDFISDVKGVSGIRFRRPLQTTHEPAVTTGAPEPFTVASIPGVTFTVLHTDKNPPAGDCGYQINDASIVIMAEIDGVRFLFTGDANGKERDEAGTVQPTHVEAKLLALEAAHPGTLKADVLKVPHHGSETASTTRFIDAIDPRFVVISASVRHDLPRAAVVTRYRKPGRTILRTDDIEDADVDHVVCARKLDGELTCRYRRPTDG